MRPVGGYCPKSVRATCGARGIGTSCSSINQMLAECSSNICKIEFFGLALLARFGPRRPELP